MPGELKPDATCPECGDPLLAIIDTVSADRVIREYHHDKNSPKARRRRYCKAEYVGDGAKEYAKRERRELEKQQ